MGELYAYSGYFNDTPHLLDSASGGGATILALSVIRRGGIVFGASYSPDFRTAEFSCAEREQDLAKLKGSKYIWAAKRIMIDGEYFPIWPCIAEKLRAGREVLFTGLPCDVGALNAYLRANHVDTSKLFTCDLICTGPTLPEIHRQYTEQLEAKYHSRITSFTVRHKAKGWTPPYVRAVFENGQEFLNIFYETDYGRAFGLLSCEQCYHCRFKGKNHQADLTLGDYWGLTPEMKGWNPNGVSIFIVRTQKGHELISRLEPEEFTIEPTNLYFALEHNHMYYESRKLPEDYGKFCDDLKFYGLHKAVVNHYGGRLKYALMLAKVAVKKLLRKILPAPARQAIKKILGRT